MKSRSAPSFNWPLNFTKRKIIFRTRIEEKRRHDSLDPVVNDRVNSGTPDTSHRLEASMMNAETALWGTFTPARALGQGGIVAVREGDEWRGGVVRHSANVTYCLFRGAGGGMEEGEGVVHETPCRSTNEGDDGEQLTLGVALCIP